jgi:hypothetical protein
MPAFLAMTLIILMASSGCTDADSPVTMPQAERLPWPQGQKALFDITRVNYAWGYHLSGYYIDTAGGIYSYDHSDEQWVPSTEPIPAAELFEKYSHKRELVGLVSLDSMAAVFKLVSVVSESELAERVDMGCRDFGSIVHYAYLYDPDDDTYAPILLYQRGDWGQRNKAEEARSLYDWINSVVGLDYDDTCGP